VWRLRLAPAVWRPAFGDDVTSDHKSVNLENVNLAEADIGVTVDAELAINKWVFRAGGFSFASNNDGNAKHPLRFGTATLASGDAFSARASLSSAQFTIGRRFHKLVGDDASDIPTAAHAVDFSLDIYAGVRSYDARFTLRSPVATDQSVGGVFVEPIVGAGFGVNVFDKGGLRFNIDAGGQPFGDRTSTSFDIQVAFELRPSRTVGAFIGWRQIVVDLQKSDDAFNTSLAGLFFGVVVAF